MPDMHGRVESLLLTKKELPSEPVNEVEVTLEGFVGDKHFGYVMKANIYQKEYPKGTPVRNVRQISVVSTEELDDVAKNMELPRIDAAWVGANMEISGIPDFTQLPSGSRLYFEGGVGIAIEGENLPCTTAGGSLQQQYPDRNDITSAFPKKAIRKRGVVAWVERPGVIRKGEKVMVRLAEDVQS
jgi:MOSC domain-containing protein YiiM